MQEANKLILLGNDSIPYSKRVELALKIKGVPFELEQQESIASPTQPSSQKSTRDSQPSRATLESLVIIEYIDQTWKQEPKFLTEDPNERARVRFLTGCGFTRSFPCRFCSFVLSRFSVV